MLTKAEFLANLQVGREQLWAFVEGLTVAHFTAQRDAAGWTIQDHLLHLADWRLCGIGLATPMSITALDAGINLNPGLSLTPLILDGD